MKGIGVVSLIAAGAGFFILSNGVMTPFLLLLYISVVFAALGITFLLYGRK